MKDLYGNYDDEMVYQEAIRQPLEVKIQQSLQWIRDYEQTALEIHPDGYYVAFSGGKDSIVMERLFRMAGVKYEAFYNNTTIDPPELIYFIRKYYPKVQWNNPQKHLIAMMAENKTCGPPTRSIRWCCEIFKEQGGQGRFRSIGVRGPESPRRKATWSFLSSHNKDGLPILCPLIYWTDSDIWRFIRGNKMAYCSLYDQGFSRLGCIGCPLGGPAGQRKEFKRWPKYEAMWKRGFQKYFNKYKGVPRNKKSKCPDCNGSGWVPFTDNHDQKLCGRCDGTGKVFADRAIEKFATVEALWRWWISGKASKGDNSDCQSWLW